MGVACLRVDLFAWVFSAFVIRLERARRTQRSTLTLRRDKSRQKRGRKLEEEEEEEEMRERVRWQGQVGRVEAEEE